jgi:hypothetical protein
MFGKQELINRSCLKNGTAKTEHAFSPAFPARNNRSFAWFAIGEKERPISPAEDPRPQKVIVRN